MNGYWVIHLNNGETIDFNEQCGYICIYAEEGMVHATMKKGGSELGMVPINNILWIECVRRGKSVDT